MVELFIKGGFLMWPILLCSVIGVAVITEKSFLLLKARRSLIPSLDLINKMIIADESIDSLRGLQLSSKDVSLIAENIIGEERITDGGRIYENRISKEINEITKKFDKGLNTLAVIANLAPVLGLLGTVIGMIKAFMTIELSSSQVNPSLLAGGIWEALLTTAAGLMVAIPVQAVYHYLDVRTDEIRLLLKETFSDLMEYKSVNG